MSEANPILSGFQVAGTIVTGGALIFTALTFGRLRKTEQVKIGDRFFYELSNLRKELGQIKGRNLEDEEDGFRWRLLNTVEWNAFLINEKEVTDKKLIRFFRDVFVDFYELMPAKNKSEPTDYPEWKELRENIRLGAYD